MAYKIKDSEHLKMLKLPKRLHSKLKLAIALEELSTGQKIYMNDMMITGLQGYVEEILDRHSLQIEVSNEEQE